MENYGKIIAILCFLSFTLTIDYSLSLISEEAYWVSTGGNKRLSGVVFGLYDASPIVVAPLLAWYLGKGGSYKKMFLIGLIINIVGNAFYAMADLVSRWSHYGWVMIVVG